MNREVKPVVVNEFKTAEHLTNLRLDVESRRRAESQLATEIAEMKKSEDREVEILKVLLALPRLTLIAAAAGENGVAIHLGQLSESERNLAQEEIRLRLPENYDVSQFKPHDFCGYKAEHEYSPPETDKSIDIMYCKCIYVSWSVS